MLWSSDVGGGTLCVTVGLVTGVDVKTYLQSCTTQVALEINAIIIDGHIGSPILMGDKVCGVTFESEEASKDVEYIG